MYAVAQSRHNLHPSFLLAHAAPGMRGLLGFQPFHGTATAAAREPLIAWRDAQKVRRHSQQLDCPG